MVALLVEFAGEPPYVVGVLEARALHGFAAPEQLPPPLVSRGESTLRLELKPALYRLEMRAARGIEQRWVAVGLGGARVQTQPVAGRFATRRNGRLVESWGPDKPRQEVFAVLLVHGGALPVDLIDALQLEPIQIDAPGELRLGLSGALLRYAKARPVVAPREREARVLAALRRHPDIAAAGPAHRRGADFSLLKPIIHVQFRAGTSDHEAAFLIARCRPVRVRPSRLAPRRYTLQLPLGVGRQVSRFVELLALDPRVQTVEPGFGERPVMHAPVDDLLAPMLWDRELLRVPEALEVVGAAPPATVRVLDLGFAQYESSPEIDVSSSSSVAGTGRHGVHCLGLIGAAADPDGTYGASPGGPLVAVLYASFGTFDMGLGPEVVPLDADVFSGSLGITGVLPNAMLALSDAATRLGRGGRGLPQFYSAGDSSPASTVAGNSFGASEFGFTTAAFMLDEPSQDVNAGVVWDPTANQIKLPNGNAGPEVDWAAPGPDGDSRRVWTTDSTVDGEMPIDESLMVTVDAVIDAAAGKYTVTGPRPTVVSLCNKVIALPVLPNSRIHTGSISVSNVVETSASTFDVGLQSVPAPLSAGDHLLLSAVDLGTVTVSIVNSQDQVGIVWHAGAVLDPGEATYFIAQGTSFRRTVRFDATTVSATELDALLVGASTDYTAQAGDTIGRPALGARSFGATSAANALAAGLGALALRANPQLTWLELREVLKDSAADLLGSGLSTVAYEEAFGAGRLDALAAVNRALEYVAERADLHIRDSLADQGDGPTAPMISSPDIWVRHSDPVRYVDPNDPTPLAVGEVHLDYGVSDQHQEPIHGQTNYVHVRVRNRGTRTSPVARVILYVASAHANDLMEWPGVRASTDTSIVRAIGDPIEIGPMAPDAISIVRFSWTAAEMLDLAIHPAPFLLAEITPQDGALAEPHVHRNTNLALRGVTMLENGDAAPTIEWRTQMGQPLGFSATPGPLTVRVHLPGGQLSPAVFNAHGRRRSDDLPVTISNLPVLGSAAWIAGNHYEFTFDVPADWAEFVLEAEIGDGSSPAPPSDQRFHRMAVRLPIQLTLLLDRSGSMGDSAGSVTKWAAARRAAVLFDSIYDVFKIPGDTFKAIGFHRVGGAFTTTGTTIAALPAGGPNGGTPLGEAVLHGAADGTAGGFAYGAPGERVLVLLTDGKHNGVTSLDDVRAALPANPVSVVDDALEGVRIHACAFGAPGTVDTDALEGLVHGGDDPSLRHFAGRLQSTENLANADDAGALTEMFLSVISDVTGVELIGPIDANNNAFVIEPGVDKALFVAPADTSGLSLTDPDGNAVPVAAPSAGYDHGHAVLSSPTAGEWTLLGTPTTDCFVLVDLQLTSDFSVDPTQDGGFDCAVRLLFAGQPTTDARCELRARGPGEAIGEAILRSGVRLNPRYKGERSKRGRLVQGTIKRRNRGLRIANNLHLLQPTGAGRFATTLDGPLRTGTWSFELKVTGTTPSGAPFERLVRASRVIAAQPDATTSAVQWATLPNGKQQVVITPKDARGDRLGPGLDLKTLADGKGRALVDRGDGTYAAVFDARRALKLSKRLGARSIPAPRPRLFGVKATVTRVRIGDSHDGRGAGEWVFVSRAQIGRRRKSTRLPRRGVLSLRPNATLAPDSLVLDERVLEGEPLTLVVAAFELDGRAQWTTKLVPSGAGVTRVGRHRLRLQGDPRAWAGVHRVGDRAWQIEVRIEVDGSSVKPQRTPPRRP